MVMGLFARSSIRLFIRWQLRARNSAEPLEGCRVETGLAPDFKKYYITTEGTKEST